MSAIESPSDLVESNDRYTYYVFSPLARQYAVASLLPELIGSSYTLPKILT
jgi:hypothetical protein